MRKSWLLILLGMLFSLTVITACDKELHVHNYNTDWEKDAVSHWYRCFDCKEVTNTEAHSGGEATCTQKATCETCGQTYGEVGEHVYNIQNADETQHWKECSCGLVDENSITQHTGGEATCEMLATCEICDTAYGEFAEHIFVVDGADKEYHWKECACGEVLQASKELHHDENTDCLSACVCETCGVTYKEEGEHSYTLLQYDASFHWWKCLYCESESKGKDVHYGGEATCEEQALCEGCNQPYGDFGWHVYTKQEHDEIHHWKACDCGEIDVGSKTLHYGGEATCKERAICEECNQPYGEPLEHTYTVEKCDEAYTWRECVCGEIEEGSKTPIKSPEPPDDGLGGDIDNGSNDDTEDGAGDTSTDNPTDNPSDNPTDNPTDNPSDNPTDNPTDNPSDNPTDNPSDDTFVTPMGEGSENNPYVLTVGVSYRWSVSSYDELVYFVYETDFAGIASFIGLENVDDTSFQVGTDTYFMEGIDPAYIPLSTGETYYFICRANTAGEMKLIFIIE